MRMPGLRNARPFVLLLLPLCVGCFLGEDEDSTAIGPTSGLVTVILENKDAQPAHLFLTDQGETFPCCQVVAGGDRSVQVNTHEGWDIPVQAGRNGLPLASKQCKVTLDHIARHFMTATYRSSGWSC